MCSRDNHNISVSCGTAMLRSVVLLDEHVEGTADD